MRIPFITRSGAVGREDRLVRGCIALSLVLLAGFAVLASGEFSAISIAFLLFGAYFSVTAILGRDPLYAHFGVDTRSEAELPAAPHRNDASADEPSSTVDLRTTRVSGAEAPSDASRVGG